MYIRMNFFSILAFLVIPIMALVYFVPASITKSKDERRKHYYLVFNAQDKQNNNSFNPNNNELFEDFISNDLNNSAIIVNKIENGKKLSEFIKNKTNIKLNYYIGENELNLTNYENFIIYIEKEGKSNFYLKIKDKSMVNLNFEFKNIFNYISSFFSHNKNYGAVTIFQSLIFKYLENENENNLDFF